MLLAAAADDDDDSLGVHGFLAPPFQLGQRFSSGTPAMAEEICIPHPKTEKRDIEI